jgi:hypothetical protein
MRCSELLRASRWLLPAIPPPAPILPPATFARSQRAALAVAELGVVDMAVLVNLRAQHVSRRMNAQQITERAERLYFRCQNRPWRQLLLALLGAFFGLAYARFSTTAFQVTVVAALSWLLFLGPFVSGYLPFSGRIREFWRHRRERRRHIDYVAVEGPFWIGVGLALFGISDVFLRPSSAENFPFCVGVALIACTPLFALLSFTLRRVFRTTNVANK